MTASLLLEQRSSPTIAEQTELLRELNFGVREGLPRGTSVAAAKQIIAKRLKIPVSEVVDNTETLCDVHKRQILFMQYIRKDIHDEITGTATNVNITNEGQEPSSYSEIEQLPVKILCISHGGFIKAFIKSFCAIEVPEKIQNCSVSRIRVVWKDSASNDFTCIATPADINRIYHYYILQHYLPL
jgi:broad specificity phosphatase PhoE